MSSGVSSAKSVKMRDGTTVRTEVISREDELHIHLPDFISGAKRCCYYVGFDTEWMVQLEAFYGSTKAPNQAKIALLKLCNNSGLCLLIKLHNFERMPNALVEFLAIRDLTFVGVNISKELEKLKEDYGLEIKNTVDLTSFFTTKWRQSVPYEFGARRPFPLKRLDQLWKYTSGLEPEAVDEELVPWLMNNPWNDFGGHSSNKQFEYVIFSAYAAVKIAKHFYNAKQSSSYA